MVKVLSITFQQCYGALPRSFVKGPLKRDFLDIYLITFFRVRKFKNTSAMRVAFFLKMFKIESKYLKSKKKKIKNIFFVSDIIPSQNIAISCVY